MRNNLAFISVAKIKLVIMAVCIIPCWYFNLMQSLLTKTYYTINKTLKLELLILINYK